MNTHTPANEVTILNIAVVFLTQPGSSPHFYFIVITKILTKIFIIFDENENNGVFVDTVFFMAQL